MGIELFPASTSASKRMASASFSAGYVLVSLGMLLCCRPAAGDITNHLLNKPETFFALPHAILYSGVASAVVGTVPEFCFKI